MYVKIITFLFIVLILFCIRNKKESFLIEDVLKEKQIHYYFTNPFDHFENEKLKKEIISIIQNTQESLYIFSYDFDEEDIIAAIENALKKNVEVKILLSSDVDYSLLRLRKIPYEVYNGSGLQHIKLILSDKKILFAGTGNFSRSSLFYNSDMYFKIFINEDIAQQILEKIYYKTRLEPIIIQTPFYKIKILSSPENGNSIQSIINNEIQNAGYFINFFIYSFFDPTIMNSLYLKSKENVFVKGIVDTTSTLKKDNKVFYKFIQKNNYNSYFIFRDNFQFQFMNNSGILRGSKFHHKTIIIDNKIYTGSFNFSKSARDENNEIFFEILDFMSSAYVFNYYSKLYNYSVPVMERINFESSPFDTYIESHKLCQNSSGDSFYKQGNNAFMFVLYNNNEDCIHENYSSGIVSSSTDFFPFMKGILSKDFENKLKIDHQNPFFNCEDENCDPCKNYQCEFLKFNKWNSNQNWFSLRELIHFDIFYIWTGSQFVVANLESITSFENLFYYIFNTQENMNLNEGIIFLPYQDKKILYIGCLKKNNLRKNLKNFLILLDWYYEKNLNLSQICYEML